MNLWDTLLNAGREYGITLAGYKALESLRLEKCYRYWSAEITPGETPYESAQGFAVKLGKGDFCGRAALLRQKAQGIRRKLVPLTLTDRVVIYGGEAIWYDGRVVSRVRSGGYGYTIEQNIALCYLPIELTALGTTVRVQVFGEHASATVSPDPLYDAQGSKLR
jgi:glycine cleavage system aminomethyltransferase T